MMILCSEQGLWTMATDSRAVVEVTCPWNAVERIQRRTLADSALWHINTALANSVMCGLSHF